MSSPSLHSQAAGIHPGAYVQGSAPDTSSIQDSTLWVDTSGGEPYQLKCWDAGAARWRLIGVVTPSEVPPGALPAGTPGALLYYDGTAWTLVPAGTPGQGLELVVQGFALRPQWADSCCGVDLPAKTPSDTGEATVNLSARCGASIAMATWLEQYYSNARTALVYGTTSVLSWALLPVVDLLGTLATGGEGAPFLAAAQGPLLKAAKFIVGYAIGETVSDVLPVLTTEDNAAILKECYLALPTRAGSITVDQAALDSWASGIASATMPVGPAAQHFLGLLLHIASVGSWQQLAFNGASQPSPICSAWELTGTAMSGGAALGAFQGKSLQGGATIGQPLLQALQGGATIGA